VPLVLAVAVGPAAVGVAGVAVGEVEDGVGVGVQAWPSA
jgi:hypothetical protein